MADMVDRESLLLFSTEPAASLLSSIISGDSEANGGRPILVLSPDCSDVVGRAIARSGAEKVTVITVPEPTGDDDMDAFFLSYAHGEIRRSMGGSGNGRSGRHVVVADRIDRGSSFVQRAFSEMASLASAGESVVVAATARDSRLVCDAVKREFMVLESPSIPEPAPAAKNHSRM